MARGRRHPVRRTLLVLLVIAAVLAWREKQLTENQRRFNLP